MSMDVFNPSFQVVTLGQARAVLERRLDPKLIKEREVGGTRLSYIGGHTVIRLLNEAFGYTWSFEIVSDQIVESQPKPAWDGWGKNRKAKIDPATGKQLLEAQPPVVKVLGRLTVPGYGVKEQYGSKVLIGGATEQEAAFKSASTDAMKKCATLFGIGLELYEDDDDAPSVPYQGNQSTPTSVVTPQAQPPQQSKPSYSAPAQPTVPTQWEQTDINRLKELKAILGITENPQLDPYVREFMDDANATYMNIGPHNVKAFNIFLAKKM